MYFQNVEDSCRCLKPMCRPKISARHSHLEPTPVCHGLPEAEDFHFQHVARIREGRVSAPFPHPRSCLNSYPATRSRVSTLKNGMISLGVSLLILGFPLIVLAIVVGSACTYTVPIFHILADTHVLWTSFFHLRHSSGS